MAVKRMDDTGGLEVATLPTAECPAPSGRPGELKFGVCDGFYPALRRRVDGYFRSTGRRPRDCPQMYLKTALLVGWFVASYVLLVFAAWAWWQAVPLAVSVGLSMAAIGFNV